MSTRFSTYRGGGHIRPTSCTPNRGDQTELIGASAIVRLSYFFCAKGVVRTKLAVCDWGLLQFGSDMQKGSFFS